MGEARSFRVAGSGSVLAAALGFLACGAPVDPVHYEMVTVEETEGPCDEGGAEPCGRVTLVYPRWSGGSSPLLADRLNDQIEQMLLAPVEASSPPTNADDLTTQFLASYVETQREFPDSASTQQAYLERRIVVEHLDEQLVTVARHEQSFTGGAHPNASVRYSTFDRRDGHRVTLEELLGEGRLADLELAAEEAFRKARNLEADADLAEAGFWFDRKRFATAENFGVVDDGILFHFDAYEVAPYALGPTDFLVADETLRPWVKPAGLLKAALAN